MKYFNFKTNKFLSFFRNINLKKYKFFRIYRIFNLKGYNFSRLFRPFNLKNYNYSRFFRPFNLKNYNYSRLFRSFNFQNYNYSRIYRVFNIKSYIKIFYYALGLSFLTAVIYLNIPLFFNYEKLNIANLICKDFNAKCSINGKISYSFLPAPQIKIKNFYIKDFFEEKNNLAEIKNLAIKVSIKNLLDKENLFFKKIEAKNAILNVNLDNINKYKKIFPKKKKLIPINFRNSDIKFFEGKNYITSLENINLNFKMSEENLKAVLKGNFLNDNIYLNLNMDDVDTDLTTDLIFKMRDFGLLIKVNLFKSNKDKDSIEGNILVKKDKNRFTAVTNYKNNQIKIIKSNVNNPILDGNLEGKIILLPYFNFDLALNLNSISFSRLLTYILGMSEVSKNNLFKINEKINGKLLFSADKIYSKNDLINFIESRIVFSNGHIKLEQLLLDLGKLGAADIVGNISNEKNLTKLKFEKNIFIDDQKYFFRKFGVYNKKNTSSNLFVSGNLDLTNLRLSLYEISSENKFTNEDVNYIEKEFNNFLLDGGYETFFNFLNLKEFVKLMMDETS